MNDSCSKICSKCGETKPIDEFNKNRRDCKTCHRARSKKWKEDNPEKVRELGKKWKEDNPEKVKATNRKCFLKKTHGMREEEYHDMLKKQGYVCAICCGVDIDRRLAVDHCHLKHYNRGLLCANCNTSLGKFNDNPDLIRKAARYIENHRDKYMLYQKCNVINTED